MSYRKQWEEPDANTWRIIEMVNELPSELGAALGYYLNLPRSDRRAYRILGEGLYGRFAAVFDCEQEDYIVRKFTLSDGETDSDIARRLGVSRQAVSKRLKYLRGRLVAWSEEVLSGTEDSP